MLSERIILQIKIFCYTTSKRNAIPVCHVFIVRKLLVVDVYVRFLIAKSMKNILTLLMVSPLVEKNYDFQIMEVYYRNTLL